MPSKATKKRRQENRLKQEQQRRELQPHSLAGGQEGTSEHGLAASLESAGSSTRAQQGIVEDVARLAISIRQPQRKALSLVPKPPPSNVGREIMLISNHYPLKVPNRIIYHYDVEINKLGIRKEGECSKSAEATGEDIETLKERGKPKRGKFRCLNTKLNRKILERVFQREEQLCRSKYVYDGKKNIYTTHRIPDNICIKLESFQDESERERDFEIKINPVTKEESKDNSISLEPLNALLQGRSSYIPQDAVMVLETIMRHQPAIVNIPVGRSFFSSSFLQEEMNLPGGRLVVKGYHQSMLLTEANAVLNIDMTAITFYKPGSVINFLNEMLKMMADEDRPRRDDFERLVELRPQQKDRLRKELNGCRIYATHFQPHRKFKVHGVSDKSADTLLFQINGELISVTKYFRKQHNINLIYGRFPCLKINKNRDIYLPLEVCEIPEGEPCLRHPSKLQTAQMITHTAVPPVQRFAEIQRRVDETIQRFGPHYELFGITINRNPVKVKGRVLDPPELLYKDNSTESPKNGQWNLQNKKLLRGVQISKWVILAASHRIEKYLMHKFSQELVQTADKFGLTMRPAPRIISADRNTSISELLKSVCQRDRGIQLAVVILRSKNDKEYCKVKFVAETELGIITQCVAEQNIQDHKKCNEQFRANLCLKINGKLGGQNSTIHPSIVPPILKESTMIIGADCNHPGPNDDVMHSVAAAVCNLDPEMAQFATAWTIQPRDKNKRIELMKKLKYMVIELLEHYYKHRKRYPTRIIFFRDGVSEGEYVKALEEEVPQIIEACAEKIPGGRPTLTFLIVSKRHHTRLMVQDQKDGVRPQGNIPPGTKVDTGITHILNFDFFLCSQNGIKGTSRPAHYTVVHDENEFSSRVNKPILEKLCYFLCHTSSRCTRSISIPAPIDCAHHAAMRAKQYLIAQSNNGLVATWSDEIKVASEIRHRMYYI